MNHEVYVFGSVARGEVTSNSDVDILAIPFGPFSEIEYPSDWSIYTERAVREFHGQGRLFAWHLYLEAKCLFTPLDHCLIQSLGEPSPYEHDLDDIDALEHMMMVALDELRTGTNSSIFELGIVYTTLRDIATSASWRLLPRPCFSRYAPFKIGVAFPLDRRTFDEIMIARHVATRNQIFDVMQADRLKKHVLEAGLELWVTQLKAKLLRTPSLRRLKLNARSSS